MFGLVLIALSGVIATTASSGVGIIHLHGLGEFHDDPDHKNFKDYVEKHTGVPVHLVDTHNWLASLAPLERQVPEALVKVKEIAAKYDKVIAVGYSQGGIVWRGIIEMWDDHNVDTFISIASPQHGMAGAPPLLTQLVPLIDSISQSPTFYLFVYSYLGQQIAPLNYYLDPYHYDMYLEKSKFFPLLNNEKGDDWNKARQKSNFLKLRKLVLVGGPGEDVLRPWQTAQFGYYNEEGNRENEVIDMEETRFYTEDLFGLQTMDKRGDIRRCTVAGIKHIEFRDDMTVMDSCVLPAVYDTMW